MAPQIHCGFRLAYLAVPVLKARRRPDCKRDDLPELVRVRRQIHRQAFYINVTRR